MRRPNRLGLVSAGCCFALGLMLYALSNAGYIETKVTPTNLWQIAGVSLVILFLSFATPQRAQS